MAIISSQTNAVELTKFASGKHLDTAGTSAVTITLGFTPRYFRFEGVTDRIGYEWYEGMGATNTIKTVAAGTRTLDTGTMISVDDGVVTIASVVTNTQYHWVAYG